MAIASSPSAHGIGRRLARRQRTVDEALEHAVAIMSEHGVGALTISEMARRMGVRGPSLYKYFPSLHAVYDLLFARGMTDSAAAVSVATASHEPGTASIRAAVRTIVAWCVANPALAQLMYWRPIPGFSPSAESFAPSIESMRQARAEFAAAVERGQLTTAADSDEAVRLLTVMISGLITQQMANEPGATYQTGAFTQLTDEAVDLVLARFTTDRSS